VIKNFLVNLKIEDKHPSEESLLKCADGELATRQAARVRSHLETCWTCRAQLDKIEEAISLFVDFRRTVQVPLMGPPPSNWKGFDGKLAVMAADEDVKKVGRRNRLLSWQSFFEFSLTSRFSPLLIRAFAGTALALLLVVTLVWQLTTVQSVSASELLEKSIAAQTKNLGGAVQAVVYQKLQVKRQNAPELNLDIWQDATQQHIRQLVNYSNADRIHPEKINPDSLRDLSEILRLNGMNPQRPLSAASFKAWRDTLANKTDEVSRRASEKGTAYVSLKTVNGAATSVGQISEAVLKVRESDWHPFAETLRVKTLDGEDTYELTELDFWVNDLATLGLNFFGEPAAPQFVAVANSSPATNPLALASPSAESSPIEAPETLTKAVATVDLEVEVLRLLNEAHADLGEEITVQREVGGPIYIRVLVETTARRDEIQQALLPVRNNRAVRIELKTVAEAVSEQKNAPQPSGKTEAVESQGATAAADDELLERFKTEEAARKFGRQVVARSGQAMARAYALKRLAGQFTPSEFNELSPDARGKFMALMRSHAGAFREETQDLRRDLEPVFGLSSTGTGPTSNVDDVTDFRRAVDALLSLASTNDLVVRSAFTLSASGPGVTAIKTAQFWQSLRAAEALAAKLQSIR
jgi:hypothetical protein